MSSLREAGLRGRSQVLQVLALLCGALVLGALPALAEERAMPLPQLVPEARSDAQPLKWLALEAAAGAGAAVVAVPVALLAAVGLGSLSSNLVLAAAPALLLFAVLPPLAVVGVEAWVGHRLEPGRGRVRPALWVALAVHVLVTGAAVALGASAHNMRDVALLTLGEALLLPAAVTLTNHLTRPAAPPPAPPTLPLVSLRF